MGLPSATRVVFPAISLFQKAVSEQPTPLARDAL